MTKLPGLLLCLCGIAVGAGSGAWLRPSSTPPQESKNRVSAKTPPLTEGASSFRLPSRKFVERMHAELTEKSPSLLRLQAVFMDWLQTEDDPEALFRLLVREFPGKSDLLTSAFFGAWAWKDCKAACQSITGSALTSRGAAITAAWKVACALEDEAAFSLEAGLYVKDWAPLQRAAQRNPDFARRMLAGLRDSSPGQISAPPSVMVVARGWAAADPAAALVWAASLEQGSEDAFREVSAAWFRQDRHALKTLTGPLRDRLDHDHVLTTLTDNGDPPFTSLIPGAEARAAVLLNPFATLEDVVSLVKAATAAGRRPGGLSPYPRDTSGVWSPADPRATLDALMQMPAGAERDCMVTPLLSSWNHADPEGAAEFAAAHDLKIRTQQNPLMASAEKVRGLSLAEAERVSLASGNGQPDFNALSAAVCSQVKDDPSAVAGFFAARMDKLKNDEDGWRMVLSGAAMTWSETDLAAATEWAASLPAGPVRETAIGGVIHEMSEYDSEAALKWMATLQHPDAASRDLKGVAGELKEQLGKVGARLAVQRSPLPDAAREEMLKVIK